MRVVGSSCVTQATTPRPFALPQDGKDPGYGYQWWIPYNTDGAFEALGIFGQIVYVNPAKHVVVVEASAWPQPDTDERWEEAAVAINSIVAKISH